METITLIIIIITITIIAFTSVNISYKSTSGAINTNSGPIPSPPATKTDNIGKFNPYASSQALYNLPAKDQYMSQEFRDQIDKLRTQYYYNNCASGSSAK